MSDANKDLITQLRGGPCFDEQQTERIMAEAADALERAIAKIHQLEWWIDTALIRYETNGNKCGLSTGMAKALRGETP